MEKVEKMNLSEHLRLQREDPEYLEAEKKLAFRLQIADAIIDGRIAKGWTQADLAERIGTKQANISRIECAVANPTLSLIEKLFFVLEIRHFIWAGNDLTAPQPIVRASSNTINKTGCDVLSNCGESISTPEKRPNEKPVYAQVLQ